MAPSICKLNKKFIFVYNNDRDSRACRPINIVNVDSQRIFISEVHFQFEHSAHFIQLFEVPFENMEEWKQCYIRVFDWKSLSTILDFKYLSNDL